MIIDIRSDRFDLRDIKRNTKTLYIYINESNRHWNQRNSLSFSISSSRSTSENKRSIRHIFDKINSLNLNNFNKIIIHKGDINDKIKNSKHSTSSSSNSNKFIKEWKKYQKKIKKKSKKSKKSSSNSNSSSNSSSKSANKKKKGRLATMRERSKKATEICALCKKSKKLLKQNLRSRNEPGTRKFIKNLKKFTKVCSNCGDLCKYIKKNIKKVRKDSNKFKAAYPKLCDEGFLGDSEVKSIIRKLKKKELDQIRELNK